MIPAPIVAALIAAAAQGSGMALSSSKAKKSGKLRADELKRETYANLLNEALNQRGEQFSRNLQSRAKYGRSAGNTFQNTADLVRGAFNI